MIGTSRWLLGCLMAAGMILGRADGEPGRAEESHGVVGRSISPDASFVRRESADKDWQMVREKEALRAGDLLVTGSRGALISANGEVQLSALAELSGISKFPVLETAVVLHEAKDVDLDFTLERGRVDLVNLNKEGAAHVRVRIRDRSGIVTLSEPGDRIALEVYGRWPRGARFDKNAKPEPGPAIAVIALALKGDIEIKGKKHQVTLKAPPGPALIFLHNLEDEAPSPQHLDSLPEWAKDGGKPAVSEKMQAIAKKFRTAAAAGSIREAVDRIVHSEVPEERPVGMYMLGALDDLEDMWKVMRDTKDLAVWDAGVVALRHWIGRGPGQDRKLYDALIEKAKLKPVHAETVLQLLHSYGDEDLAEPETYQMLIGYLQHNLRPIRGLAYWHLQRLVPDGKKIGYDPLAPKEEREKAIQAWHELIPAGKLPPKTTPQEK